MGENPLFRDSSVIDFFSPALDMSLQDLLALAIEISRWIPPAVAEIR